MKRVYNGSIAGKNSAHSTTDYNNLKEAFLRHVILKMAYTYEKSTQ